MDIDTAIVTTDTSGVSVAQAIKAFLSNPNPNTARTYRGALDHFVSYVGVQTIGEAAARLLTLPHGQANLLAMQYREHLLGQPELSAASVKLRIDSLRALVKLARRLGVVDWSLDVENVRPTPMRNTRGPGSVAVAKMLARVSGNTEADARARALILLLHDCGLRRGEVAGLSYPDDIDFEASKASITGKGRHDREWISLPPQTVASIQAWLAWRGVQAGPLFIALDRQHRGERLSATSIYTIVCAIGDRVGVRASPHGLRHTSITTALEATGGDVRKVRHFSRHAKVETVLTYDDARRDLGGEIGRLVEQARNISETKGA